MGVGEYVYGGRGLAKLEIPPRKDRGRPSRTQQAPTEGPRLPVHMEQKEREGRALEEAQPVPRPLNNPATPHP